MTYLPEMFDLLLNYTQKVMSNQQVIEKINQQLKQLPEDELNQVATFVEQLLIASPPSSQKEEFIRSLRGKYTNYLTATDVFIQQKQEEIDWEERSQ
jgi:hypothetical protein